MPPQVGAGQIQFPCVPWCALVELVPRCKLSVFIRQPTSMPSPSCCMDQVEQLEFRLLAVQNQREETIQKDLLMYIKSMPQNQLQVSDLRVCGPALPLFGKSIILLPRDVTTVLYLTLHVSLFPCLCAYASAKIASP